VAHTRIRIRLLDDPRDEVHADRSGCLTRAADAAEDDDLSDACDDALDYVVCACRFASLLVYRKYYNVRSTNADQSH